jgi:general secretion pathway protein E
MPSPTGPFLLRRAFLESLLLAAWGGEAAVKGAVQAGQENGRQTTSPAARAADARVPRLDDSGMRPKLLAQVRDLLARPHGMIVCCGPTVPIRTANLYACLRELDPGKKKILTVEDPIAYRLDKIAQKPIDVRGGQTYDEGLRSILKQGPDAVMVGEIRDEETATIACRAAANGPMILAGFQAGETLIALFRLLELGVDSSRLAPALTAILAQRSVRTLCDACKEPYKPKPEFLEKANIPADKVDVFYRRPQNPQGACARCGGTGISGQTGIFELLVVTEPMRRMIRRDPALAPIKAEARKNGLIYIQEDGLRQVILGRTSIEELLRAIKE